MTDPRFVKAYARGIKAAGRDYQWHWRVHVGLWAAYHAAKLEGDFVECGVNRGALSSAIMDYLNWNELDRRFFLLDTFRGLDERHISDEEKALGKTSSFGDYAECYEEVKQSFAEFKNVVIIQGSVPDTLPLAETNEVAFLHVDMNCAPPEVAAMEYFWSKLVQGAVVVLDDYAYRGYEVQKRAIDRFALDRGIQVLSLPTGQGLIIKPE